MGGFTIQPDIKINKPYSIVPFTGKSLEYVEISEISMDEDMIKPPEEKLSPVSVDLEKEDLDHGSS